MMDPQPSDGFEWTQEAWGPALRCRPLLEVANHVFTAGNLRLRDDPEQWSLVARAVGAAEVLLIRQVHRAEGVIVRRSRSGGWSAPEADVIVSEDPSVAVGARVADCAPILIGDSRRGVVAAVHAGWRGTVQRAAHAGVRALSDAFGSAPTDLVAAIGPCLGVCCGEVGPEVADAFRQAGHTGLDRWFTPGSGDRLQLDLAAANQDQLVAAGIPDDRVHVAGLCTRSHPDVFHSYRAAGANAGRMVGAIRAGSGTRDQGLTGAPAAGAGTK